MRNPTRDEQDYHHMTGKFDHVVISDKDLLAVMDILRERNLTSRLRCCGS
jgi:hypothetical protein